MLLPSDLISKFVKITKDDKKTKTETTVYGTVVESNGTKYVRFDGADENQLTPVVMSVDAEDGERVSVLLKDHIATVTGNMSSPAVRTETVKGVVEDVEADKKIVTDTLIAQKADIEKLRADMIDVEDLNAVNAKIENLEADKLSAKDAELKFANIDFANIGEAAIEKIFADSGIIADLVMSEGHVTGRLVGVTIVGDIIEGNTVKADKLVILGTDGLYYKLNTDGVTTTAEQTEYNSLNGSIITAKTITAEKVNVDDLVAFGATIGGFHLTKNSIYSGVKKSVDNTTRGIYQDTDGQFVAGDASRFIKFYKDADGTYKLAISANSIMFGDESRNLETDISDAAKTAKDFLEFDAANGLQIGNKTSGAWSGFRAQITAGAYNILNAAGTVLASYGEKLIELGKNATDAIIKLCGGKGEIKFDTDPDTNNSYLEIYSPVWLRLRSALVATLSSKSGNNEGTVNASPEQVYLGATNGTESSEVAVNIDGIEMDTKGYLNIRAEHMSLNGDTVSTLTVDRLTSYGNNTTWRYSLWSDGRVDMWGVYSISDLACTTALGSMYRTVVLYPDNFPITINSPQLVASYEAPGYGAMLWATTNTTSTSPPNYYLIRPVSGTIVSGKIIFHVTGTWK